MAGAVVAAGEMGRRWVVADSREGAREGCQQVVRDWERGLVLGMEIRSGEGGGRGFYPVFASVRCARFSADFLVRAIVRGEERADVYLVRGLSWRFLGCWGRVALVRCFSFEGRRGSKEVEPSRRSILL